MLLKNQNLFWDGQKTFWEKEKNARYQHFLLFPKCFQKVSFSGLLKVGIYIKRVRGLKIEILLYRYFLFQCNLENTTESSRLGKCCQGPAERRHYKAKVSSEMNLEHAVTGFTSVCSCLTHFSNLMAECLRVCARNWPVPAI